MARGRADAGSAFAMATLQAVWEGRQTVAAAIEQLSEPLAALALSREVAAWTSRELTRWLLTSTVRQGAHQPAAAGTKAVGATESAATAVAKPQKVAATTVRTANVEMGQDFPPLGAAPAQAPLPLAAPARSTGGRGKPKKRVAPTPIDPAAASASIVPSSTFDALPSATDPASPHRTMQSAGHAAAAAESGFAAASSASGDLDTSGTLNRLEAKLEGSAALVSAATVGARVTSGNGDGGTTSRVGGGGGGGGGDGGSVSVSGSGSGGSGSGIDTKDAVTAAGAGTPLASAEETESAFQAAIARTATAHHGIRSMATLHAALLSSGLLPLSQPLKAAARCMLLPPPPQDSCGVVATAVPSTPAAAVSPASDEAARVAAIEALQPTASLESQAEACAYASLLLHLARGAIDALDDRLASSLFRSQRLKCTSASVPPLPPPLPLTLPSPSLPSALPLRLPRLSSFTAAAVSSLPAGSVEAQPSAATATAVPPPLAAAAVAAPIAPLRAHTLPPSWHAEPPTSASPGWSAGEMRAWRNQHKMSDLLQGMEREYPHGQPAGMGAIRLDLPDASKELKKELLPENGRWFARYITQRLVLTCLGGGGHGADDAVAGVAALGRSAAGGGGGGGSGGGSGGRGGGGRGGSARGGGGASSSDPSGEDGGGHGYGRGKGGGRWWRQRWWRRRRRRRRRCRSAPQQAHAAADGQPDARRRRWRRRGGGRCGGGGSGADGGGAKGGATVASVGSKWFAEGTAEFFWYRLLTSLDSHSLASHLVSIWAARLWECASGGDADGGGGGGEMWEAGEEEQRALRCCVLSKFLGLLAFSPQWDLPPPPPLVRPSAAHSHSRAAAAAASLSRTPSAASASASALAAGGHVQPASPIDVVALVEASTRSARLCLCLPWLCGLLRMLVDDPHSRRLPCYAQALDALAALTASGALLPLLPAAASDGGPAANASGCRVRLGVAWSLQELCSALDLRHPLVAAAANAANGTTAAVAAAAAAASADEGVAAASTATASSDGTDAAVPPIEPSQLRALASLYADRRVVAYACPSYADLRHTLKSIAQGRLLLLTTASGGHGTLGSGHGHAGTGGSAGGGSRRKIAPTLITPIATSATVGGGAGGATGGLQLSVCAAAALTAGAGGAEGVGGATAPTPPIPVSPGFARLVASAQASSTPTTHALAHTPAAAAAMGSMAAGGAAIIASPFGRMPSGGGGGTTTFGSAAWGGSVGRPPAAAAPPPVVGPMAVVVAAGAVGAARGSAASWSAWARCSTRPFGGGSGRSSSLRTRSSIPSSRQSAPMSS